MPLLIISGQPFTGKTVFSQLFTSELLKVLGKSPSPDLFLPVTSSPDTSEPSNAKFDDITKSLIEANIENVVLISDETSYQELDLTRDQTYESTHVLEKRLRGSLKAATEKALASPKNLVILDHGNYIKSFRYELYCLAKSTKEKSCCLYISESLVPKNCQNKSPYSEEIFNALSFRFEEPNGNNRWDKPLITVDRDSWLGGESSGDGDFQPTSSTQRHVPGGRFQIFSKILASLYDKSKTSIVKPNNSTIAPPESNLAGMEKITQNIIDLIIKARRENQPKVELPNKTIFATPSSFEKTDNDLRRCRREFFKYIKAQVGAANKSRSSDEITALFVQYLDSSISN